MDDCEDEYLSSGEEEEEFDSYYDFSCGDPDPTPRPTPTSLPHDPSTFQDMYRCFHLFLVGKENLEGGSQILMPPSALESLLRLPSGLGHGPVLFEIQSYRAGGRVSHCGVSEFTADEGSVYLPSWMMENLQLEDGDFVYLRRKVLAKGTRVQLQPHSMDFLNIGDIKYALEECLTNKFFTLTLGDTIRIDYKGKGYSVDVVDTKPTNAINITRTDCVVDFAPPLDYKEPERPDSPVRKKTKEEGNKGKKNVFLPFSGTADAASALEPEKPDCALPTKTREEGGVGKRKLFLPFSGTPRRLDAGTSMDAVRIPITDHVVDVASALEPKKPDRPLRTKTREEGDVGEKTPFLPFCGTSRRLSNGTPTDAAGGSQEKPTATIGFKKERSQILKERLDEGSLKKEPFQAFSGKKYSLMD